MRGDLIDQVNKVSFGDVCQKHLCSTLVNYLIKNVLVKAPSGYELVIKRYYARGGGGIDCHFVKPEKTNQKIAIGVSLEGHSFRRVLIKREGSTLANLLKCGQKMKWFSINKSNGIITFPGDDVKERATGMRSDKCTYEGPASNHYMMVYQHWRIDSSGMSFADIAMHGRHNFLLHFIISDV